MSMHDRAAQFAPFAALTGFDAQITEAGRLTQPRIDPGEDALAELDQALRFLLEHVDQKPEATITWFVQDANKDGGAYETVTGRVRRIDMLERTLTLTDGRAVPLGDIVALRAEDQPSGGESSDIPAAGGLFSE